jgi:hypothetical protein
MGLLVMILEKKICVIRIVFDDKRIFSVIK